MKRNKKISSLPKLRHVWAINPKTRVTPSKKDLSRKSAKNALKSSEEFFD